MLRRIDWQTPAAILEKIIAYEAVHEIQGWDDLRRRLDPGDRRCFAFFHPSLIDEPLIFVEVALMRDIPDDIQSVLRGGAEERRGRAEPTTAVFYSISNCQEGLQRHLVRQLPDQAGGGGAGEGAPSLKTFVTLSPVPSFARWLDERSQRRATVSSALNDVRHCARLRDPRWVEVRRWMATERRR